MAMKKQPTPCESAGHDKQPTPGTSLPQKATHLDPLIRRGAANKPMNGPGIFKSTGSVLRNSGVAGAHRLGSKKG